MVVGIAILLAIALIAGIVVLLNDDPDPPAGSSPTTAADVGVTYDLRVTDDADPTEDTPEGVHFQLTATAQVSPPDIRPGASIEVNIGDVSARFDDGTPLPVGISRPQTLRIDDHGEPDSVLIAAADSSGAFFYIVDVLFPVIPSDTSSEGATWTMSFAAGVPTGSGTATYEGTGELVRFEDVAGVEAAVVRNELTFTYDLTMQASEVAFLSGLGPGAGGTSAVTGTGTLTLTGWIDLATGRVLRAEGGGRYDTVFTYEGYDQDVVDLEGDYPTEGSFGYSIEPAGGG